MKVLFRWVDADETPCDFDMSYHDAIQAVKEFNDNMETSYESIQEFNDNEEYYSLEIKFIL